MKVSCLLLLISVFTSGKLAAQFISPQAGRVFETDVKNMLVNTSKTDCKKITITYTSLVNDVTNQISTGVYTFLNDSTIKCFYINADPSPNRGQFVIRDSDVVECLPTSEDESQYTNDRRVETQKDSAGYHVTFGYTLVGGIDTDNLDYYRGKWDTKGRMVEEYSKGYLYAPYFNKFYYQGDSIHVDSDYQYKDGVRYLEMIIYNHAYSEGGIPNSGDTTVIRTFSFSGIMDTSVYIDKYKYNKRHQLVKAHNYSYSGNHRPDPLSYTMDITYTYKKE
jgi:hypothetical protein